MCWKSGTLMRAITPGLCLWTRPYHSMVSPTSTRCFASIPRPCIQSPLQYAPGHPYRDERSARTVEVEYWCWCHGNATHLDRSLSNIPLGIQGSGIPSGQRCATLTLSKLSQAVHHVAGNCCFTSIPGSAQDDLDGSYARNSCTATRCYTASRRPRGRCRLVSAEAGIRDSHGKERESSVLHSVATAVAQRTACSATQGAS